MSKSKPFLEMPKPVANYEGEDLWRGSNIREMHEKYEAKIAELEKHWDCGQDGVCAISPGCVRHFAERNRELIRERDEALARAEKAEANAKAFQDEREAITRLKVFITQPGVRYEGFVRLSDIDDALTNAPYDETETDTYNGLRRNFDELFEREHNLQQEARELRAELAERAKYDEDVRTVAFAVRCEVGRHAEADRLLAAPFLKKGDAK